MPDAHEAGSNAGDDSDSCGSSYDSTLAEDIPDWAAVRMRRAERYQRFWDRQTKRGTQGYVSLDRMARIYAEDRLRSEPVRPTSGEE
jgi:hypothetical protein